MAGFGYNMHRDPNQNRKRPYPTPQIACRICDQVFMSTQALINHIETHMIEDEAAARKQQGINLRLSQSQRDPHHCRILPNPSPYQYPNFTMSPAPLHPPMIFQQGFVHPQQFQDRNPFPVVPVQPTAAAPRFLMPRPVPQTRMIRKFMPRGPELQHSYANMSQMQPQYMATVNHRAAGNPQFLAPQHPPTNDPNAVMPPEGRDRQNLNNTTTTTTDDNNNNKTSDDTETLDLTLRL